MYHNVTLLNITRDHCCWRILSNNTNQNCVNRSRSNHMLETHFSSMYSQLDSSLCLKPGTDFSIHLCAHLWFGSSGAIWHSWLLQNLLLECDTEINWEKSKEISEKETGRTRSRTGFIYSRYILLLQTPPPPRINRSKWTWFKYRSHSRLILYRGKFFIWSIRSRP